MASGYSDQDVEYALSKLLPIGTVSEYENEFEILINRVTGISQSLLKSLYIFGLKLELQRELLRTRPTALAEAFCLARITEARYEDERPTIAIAKPNDLTTRENCYSILNANEVDNTKPPLFVHTFGNNGGDDLENSNPVTSAEEVVDSRHSSTLSSSVEHESPNLKAEFIRVVGTMPFGVASSPKRDGTTEGHIECGNDHNAEYALSKLLQMGTVVEYESKFVVLANRVTGITKSLLTSFYISGLKLTLQIDLLRARPITLGEAFALARITEARFEDERATTVIAKSNERNIVVQVQDSEETTLHTSNKVETMSTSTVATYEEHGSPTGKKGDLGAITSKGGLPDHMRASKKELAILKSPLEQKSMFKCQERMLRRQEQQRLAKVAKIERRIWDPRIKGLQDNTLWASNRDAEDALSKLLQISTVTEYQDEIEMLINRVTRISESLLASFYISRLKVVLQIELLGARPTTLGEAFSLARITKTRFEDERSASAIAKLNDLNTRVHVQDFEETTRHKPNKVEVIKSSGSSLLVESKYYAANQVGLIFNQSNEAIYYERILELIVGHLCQYLCKHILDFEYDLQEANLQLKT
nr:reverse transcriptase [Tanacetum cinerariifolium]